MAVTRKGGIRIGGGAMVGQPSAAGLVRPDENLFRVDFDRDKFAAVIRDKGYDVTWEKGQYCPNRKGPGSQDHAIDCAICDGSGFVYYDAIDTRVLMQAIKLSESYYAYGRYSTGTVLITAMPEFRLSFWDHLTMLDGVARFSELLFRQPETLRDRPKYDLLQVCRLSWIDRSEALQAFTEAIDYTIDATTGEIVWVAAGSRPDPRSYYSASYTYRPEYEIIDLVHQIRESPIRDPATGADRHYEFPVQVVAQLSFLARNEGLDDRGEDTRRNPFSS